MGVVGESVEQSRGQLLVAEYADPLGEGEVGGDDGRASLVAVGEDEDVEEQFAAGAVERHEPELVADQEVDPLKALLEAAQLPLITGFEEVADEVGGLAEPDPAAALRGLDAECDREMRLAGANGSDENDVVAAVDVVAGGQLAAPRARPARPLAAPPLSARWREGAAVRRPCRLHRLPGEGRFRVDTRRQRAVGSRAALRGSPCCLGTV